MTLANMRQNGVRAVAARCEACGHEADVNVDALAETIAVPRVGRRLRCSRFSGRLRRQSGILLDFFCDDCELGQLVRAK
jgi:hypothetical protein